MIKIYKFLKQILIIAKNIPMLIQLVLIFLAMLVALYWFINLTGNTWMAFFQPVATNIMKFVHSFYHQQAQMGQRVIDGSLLLFDLILFAIIFVIGKSTWLINQGIILLDKLIDTTKRREEAILNRKLEAEMIKEILQYDNYAIALKFELQDSMVNNFWGGDKNAGVAERKEKVLNHFDKALGILNNVKIAKTDNRILVLARDFQTFDRTMLLVISEMEKLKAFMMQDRWIMNWYGATILYKDEDMKLIYADLQKLMNLQLRNEVICFGNFSLRYSQINKLSQKFNIERRGSYSIEGNEVAIWRLVKKI